VGDGCARAPDGRSLALAELAADSLRVTTAFGNDNRMTYTYGSAARHKHCRGSWRMAGTEPHAWAVFECLRLSGPSTANRPALLSNSIVLRPFSLSQHPHGVRVSEHAGHAQARARAGRPFGKSAEGRESITPSLLRPWRCNTPTVQPPKHWRSSVEPLRGISLPSSRFFQRRS